MFVIKGFTGAGLSDVDQGSRSAPSLLTARAKEFHDQATSTVAYGHHLIRL